MNINYIFLAAALYGFVYIFLVDRAVKAVLELMPEYERSGKLEKSMGWTKSTTALKLMLDNEMPREDFPEDVMRKIAAARFFFETTPIVYIGCIVLIFFI